MATVIVRLEDSEGGAVTATLWYDPPHIEVPAGESPVLTPAMRMGIRIGRALRLDGHPVMVASGKIGSAMDRSAN